MQHWADMVLGVGWRAASAAVLVAGLTAGAEPEVAVPAASGEVTEHRLLQESRDRIERVRKSDAVIEVVDAKGRPVEGARVTATQTDSDFQFSANVTILTGELGGKIPLRHYKHRPFFTTRDQVDVYKQRFAELFNAATIPFYWRMTETEQGAPDFTAIDRVLDWCEAEGITAKGHPLVWTNPDNQPDWLKVLEPAAKRTAIETHVRDTVTRFRGRIQVWDVINEAAWANRTLAGMSSTNYVSLPFTWARESDPHAILMANDAHAFSPNPKMARAVAIAASYVSNSVPCDAIGVQAHIHRTSRFRLDVVLDVLERYREAGLPVHVTEFTPCSDGKPIMDSWKTGVWDEEEQAAYSVIFYTLCFSVPEVKGIGWWDATDYSSWQPKGGVLRADLTSKPVFHALRKLIHEDWRSRFDLKTGPDGKVRFRGFHGPYDVRVQSPAGTEHRAELVLSAGEAGAARVVLD